MRSRSLLMRFRSLLMRSRSLLMRFRLDMISIVDLNALLRI